MQKKAEIRRNKVSVETNVDVAEAESQAAPTKTFTQHEVTELIEKRLARERKKTEKYSDYDEIKAKAAELEALQEEKRLAELSEQERLQEILGKHEEEKTNPRAATGGPVRQDALASDYERIY